MFVGLCIGKQMFVFIPTCCNYSSSLIQRCLLWLKNNKVLFNYAKFASNV